MTDEQVLAAVADEEGWMRELLVRLVEAPTTLGAEDAGQAVMAEAFAACGLDPVDAPLDAGALRAAEGASPFSWDVTGKRDVVATWHPVEDGGRSLLLNGHVDGVPAHAARADRLGFDAIEAATAIVEALRRLEAELNADPPAPYDAFAHPIDLNPGIVTGGDWASTVPATCTLSCRLACFPGEDPARVRYDGLRCEGSAVSEHEPVVTVLADAYARLHGMRPRRVATTATTDARHFVRAGVPATCFGPRAERIHGIDERVSLRSMVETAQGLALFIRDWSGAPKRHEAAGTQEESHVIHDRAGRGIAARD